MPGPVIIWAPHGDDEIIGCSQALLRRNQTHLTMVFFHDGYGDDPGISRSETEHGFQSGNLKAALDSQRYLLWDDAVYYVPDPYFETHPLHRKLGHLAERLFREGKIHRLIFYTTVMTAPYIFELTAKQKEYKRRQLGLCYPEKESLWKFDHRYWLFEGHMEIHRPGEF